MSDTSAAPVLLADEVGSFPHSVLAERHPAIIRQVRDAFPYGPEQHRALDALLHSCIDGVIEPLPADAPDRDRWREWGVDRHIGKSWFEVPWLWSESYFYRCLLGAVGYFTPGAWQGIDPFRPSKLAELDAEETDGELAALDALEDRPADERARALLHGSLWGNRADLGFRLSTHGGGADTVPDPGTKSESGPDSGTGFRSDPGTGTGSDPATGSEARADEETGAEAGDVGAAGTVDADKAGAGARVGAGVDSRTGSGVRTETGPGQEAAALVADDSDTLWSLLPSSGTGTLCLVADNAGRELIPDLLLIAHLLAEKRAARAVLHVKPHPYYVSDATTADLLDALRRLTSAPGAAATYGKLLWDALTDGRLTVRAHPFSCAPLPYANMPDDLRADFADADLTVFKGDLNYRRLVGDRLWPPTTSFQNVTAYFPGPLAALRTLKSDVITGLDASTTAALTAAEGRRWRTGGTHALIQVRAAPHHQRR